MWRWCVQHWCYCFGQWCNISLLWSRRYAIASSLSHNDDISRLWKSLEKTQKEIFSYLCRAEWVWWSCLERWLGRSIASTLERCTYRACIIWRWILRRVFVNYKYHPSVYANTSLFWLDIKNYWSESAGLRQLRVDFLLEFFDFIQIKEILVVDPKMISVAIWQHPNLSDFCFTQSEKWGVAIWQRWSYSR